MSIFTEISKPIQNLAFRISYYRMLYRITNMSKLRKKIIVLGILTLSFNCLIAQPLSVSITNSVNVSCNGLCDGSLSVNVSGGTSPYAYSWNPTSSDTTAMADSLCGGQHIVFVTDSEGCIDSSVATVTDPPAIVVVPIVSNVSCFGDADELLTCCHLLLVVHPRMVMSGFLLELQAPTLRLQI